jgi:hypothetical protein
MHPWRGKFVVHEGGTRGVGHDLSPPRSLPPPPTVVLPYLRPGSQKLRSEDLEAELKRQGDLELARMRERMHRRALELREQNSLAEFNLPYESVGYGFEEIDPKQVGATPPPPWPRSRPLSPSHSPCTKPCPPALTLSLALHADAWTCMGYAARSMFPFLAPPSPRGRSPLCRLRWVPTV